ncbi:Acyl-CoA synthetase (AMP-forming)/AMP-acid ligase II [Pseudonocardia thermophila]|jgi:Acyl-CoA synthetases (AMP-forming)/AMP-acid ligases II|uniref:Acyl-CoA synthetase (AMP-forming)/AMP-acid ligase II n=1 Tax=Pseudonocardia thermophila TaxID=1848 RepID=A0A1M6T740_PSETH|nr:AMP-binding protein [Pseudonocardia thermophila]SHK52811.1 Acyl-CoA synthetase (AMP-forming)/AMP-acid ligase II [Pseudonocardia thermophila]
MDIGVAVAAHARKNPSSTAAFDGDRQLSYAELDERTNRLANTLHGRYGVAKGDRVAVLLRNRLEVAEAIVAVTKAGGVYCGLNFRMSLDEYRSIFTNAEPKVLITEAGFAEYAQTLAAEFGVAVLDVDDPSPSGYGCLADASPAAPATLHARAADDEFCIVYTSGTTGMPKGILFDSRAVATHAMVAGIEYKMSASSRWLTTIPHNSSVQITLAPSFFLGGAVGFLDARGFDPEVFAAEATKRAATHTYLVPTMLYRVLEAGLDSTSVPTLTSIGYGAAPIAPDRVTELVDRFGPVFSQLYGMAEIASIGTMLTQDDHRRIAAGRTELTSSAGRASFLADVRVVDQQGNDCPPGERGEVVFHTPYTMRGYHRNPEKTAETLVDGWVRSGDVGTFDEEGYLYIVDRIKDLIIRGGYNITPSEIEKVLYTHPAVIEAAVVGVPDKEWGEAVLAAVAVRQGEQVDEAALQAHCRAAGLPTIKIPERVLVLDSLPKNAVGKIAKRSIVEIATAGSR